MRDFNQNRRSGGGGSRFGGGNRFEGGRGGGSSRGGFGGGRDSDREMFEAVCDNCGKDCEVPFKPSGNKPILCSNCFRNKDNGDSGERRDDSRGNRFERDSDDRRPAKSYGGSDSNGQDAANLRKQLDHMNSKLDKIMNLMEAKKVQEAPLVKIPKKEKSLEAEVEKVTKEKKTKAAKPKVEKTAKAKKE